MEDKSLSIFLAAAFGIPGLSIMLLAWLLPEMSSQRLVAIVAGAVGLLVCAAQLLAFFRTAVKAHEEPAMIRVTAEERS